jgi:hypothetical protein
MNNDRSQLVSEVERLKVRLAQVNWRLHQIDEWGEPAREFGGKVRLGRPACENKKSRAVPGSTWQRAPH